jgi:4-amino-4-deoxy-L-arabinose transferase-like glycosyltransferase
MTEDALRGRIAFDGTPTPLKAVLFLVLCLTWLLPGLVGHDPWKVDEAVVFGAVSDMLSSGQWSAFHIAGEPLLDKAPLFLWTAAAFAKAFGGVLALHDAARLAAGFYMALTLGLLSLTCLELLGERAARMGVLLLIGCLGLLIRAHEMTTDLAGLTGISMALYGLALAVRRPNAGGAILGLGAGLAFIGDGLLPLGMLAALAVMLPLAAAPWRTKTYAGTVGIAVVACAPFLCAWPAAWASASLVPGDLGEMLYFARIMPWYAWPAWPLAAWTLWRARRTLPDRRDLQLPMVAFIAFFLTITVFGEAREVNALPLLLPLAILGVAELDSVPRGAASALDWFGMSTFFLFAALLWIGWGAAITGKPQFAAAWLQREIPGFTYRFDILAFVLAAILTLVWLVVVARSLRSTRRALVNWSAGITMTWMLMMTLGLPLVDQARSYRAVARRIASELPADSACTARRNVGDAQRASLDYFAQVRTIREDDAGAARCKALLVQATPLRAPVVAAQWTEAWRGARPGDRNELFILYRRQ